MRVRRILRVALQSVIPVLAIVWAGHGLLFRMEYMLLGIPSTAWYILGIVTAVMMLATDHIDRRYE